MDLDEKSAAKARATSKRPLPGSGLTFLVVDDEAPIRDFLESLLVTAGHNVRHAADGPAALRALDRGEVQFILLDLMMPEEHGISTLEKIRERDPDVPVIILTGYPETHSAVSALRLRADDYLGKPFRPNELLEAIERVLVGRGLPRNSEELFRRRLGERLRERRQREGMSQADLAELVGHSAAQVSSVERAATAVSLEYLRRAAAALRVSLSDLLRDL